MGKCLVVALLLCAAWPNGGYGQLKINNKSTAVLKNIRVEHEKLTEFARVNRFEYVLYGWHSPNWPGINSDFQALIRQEKKWYLFKSRFTLRVTDDNRRNDTLMYVIKQISTKDSRMLWKKLQVKKAFAIKAWEKQAFDECRCTTTKRNPNGTISISTPEPTDQGYDHLLEINNGQVQHIDYYGWVTSKVKKCPQCPSIPLVQKFVNTFSCLYDAVNSGLPPFEKLSKKKPVR